MGDVSNMSSPSRQWGEPIASRMITTNTRDLSTNGMYHWWDKLPTEYHDSQYAYREVPYKHQHSMGPVMAQEEERQLACTRRMQTILGAQEDAQVARMHRQLEMQKQHQLAGEFA